MRIVVMALVEEEPARFRLEATLHALSVEPGGQQPQSVHHTVECGRSECIQGRLEVILTFCPSYT